MILGKAAAVLSASGSAEKPGSMTQNVETFQ
jgi:hypothetical protein